jgi:hypothetical protein
MTLKEAIKIFEDTSGQKVGEAEEVRMIGMMPPIDQMNNALNALENCKYVPCCHCSCAVVKLEPPASAAAVPARSSSQCCFVRRSLLTFTWHLPTMGRFSRPVPAGNCLCPQT